MRGQPFRTQLNGLMNCFVAKCPLWSLADIGACQSDVRFTPESRHSGDRLRCPLSANSCRQLGLLDQLVGARDELHKRLYFDLHQCRGSQSVNDFEVVLASGIAESQLAARNAAVSHCLQCVDNPSGPN